jgi:hypothetical protein
MEQWCDGFGFVLAKAQSREVRKGSYFLPLRETELALHAFGDEKSSLRRYR